MRQTSSPSESLAKRAHVENYAPNMALAEKNENPARSGGTPAAAGCAFPGLGEGGAAKGAEEEFRGRLITMGAALADVELYRVPMCEEMRGQVGTLHLPAGLLPPGMTERHNRSTIPPMGFEPMSRT